MEQFGRTRTPNSAVDFVDILKVRHAILMAERPDKQPGVLKRKSNRAGSTIFVGPDYVEGTLMQGYELYRTLPSGLARGMYIHFLVAECHPFDDGNGRIARLMMNAELVADDAHKIIVPTVHRESYLNGMRQASQKGRFRAIVNVLHQLQVYTASIRWSDYGEAREALENHGATMEPDEGVPIFNRVLKEFGGHYLPG
ncbi:MAG: Fic family protein [Pseudomonadales bacterium]